MNPIKTSNIKDDFRICFAIVFFIIAIILIWRIGSVMNSSIKFDEINISAKYLWSLAFTLLGFCLLVLKICINSIHNLDDQKESTSKKVKEEDSEQTKRVKNLWRYFLFYPILIIVFAFLSTEISLSQFILLERIHYLVASALLSFFLGFYIDSITYVIEKLGKVLPS